MSHFVGKKKKTRMHSVCCPAFSARFPPFSPVAKHSPPRNLGSLLVQLPCGRCHKSYLNAPGSAEVQLSARFNLVQSDKWRVVFFLLSSSPSGLPALPSPSPSRDRNTPCSWTARARGRPSPGPGPGRLEGSPWVARPSLGPPSSAQVTATVTPHP